MFGLGGWEIAILGLAALVFFGPQKLPQLMRQAGKVMREVRKASFEFQNSLERELEDDPYRRAHRREKKAREKAAKLGVAPEELGVPATSEGAGANATPAATDPAAVNGAEPAAPPATQAGDAPAGDTAPVATAAPEPPAAGEPDKKSGTA